MTPYARRNAAMAKRDFEKDRKRELARELNLGDGKAPIPIVKLQRLRHLVAKEAYFDSVMVSRTNFQRKAISRELHAIIRSEPTAKGGYPTYLVPALINRIKTLLSVQKFDDVRHSLKMASKWLERLKEITVSGSQKAQMLQP